MIARKNVSNQYTMISKSIGMPFLIVNREKYVLSIIDALCWKSKDHPSPQTPVLHYVAVDILEHNM